MLGMGRQSGRSFLPLRRNDGQELAGRQHQQASQTWDLAPQVCQHREREVLLRHEARMEEDQVMPKVGNKKFPYTAKGKMEASMAERFAKKSMASKPAKARGKKR